MSSIRWLIINSVRLLDKVLLRSLQDDKDCVEREERREMRNKETI
jgi:hypothetical protein